MHGEHEAQRDGEEAVVLGVLAQVLEESAEAEENAREHLKAAQQRFQQQFLPDSRPDPIKMRFAECDPPPDLSVLDPYVTDGPCLAKFSNPQFFQDEWMREEDKRREALVKERAEESRDQ